MDINEAIRLVQAGKIKLSENCELCNRRADGVGIFVPKPEFAIKIGQPEGKTRMALYPSCSVCQKNLGTDEYMRRIELVMQADTLPDGERNIE
jgi:hypothetical protein